MRVLIAPDKFAGTLSAVEAAEAMAAGWSRHAPGDEIVRSPMSDGGPGFVDVLHASLGGDLVAATVSGPVGEPVPAAVLIVDDTAYVETAQVCGIHLTGATGGARASTYGVGELIRVALDGPGVRRLVLGLGGSGTNDAGAGMLAALGATADVPLHQGGLGLDGIARCDVSAARAAIGTVELVAASDVDIPLTGMFGATRTFGPQKGIDETTQVLADRILEDFAAVVDRRLALEKGAGAAGGLGYGLFVLGATRTSGLDLVADAVGLRDQARLADVVLTGEGAFDFSSRAGKVPYGVAAIAAEALRPCVVLAGQVQVGSREMRALGMDAAYSLIETMGQERAFAEPAAALADLAARVARTWSR